jgi:hypothetical protein
MLTGYKTYIAAALVAMFGVLQATDWVSFIGNPKAGLQTVGVAILMAILRTVTSTPPASGDK